MRSYARCSFFGRRARAQILPKSGQKSRHQPVFFYARAEGQTPWNHPCSLTAFVWRTRKTQRVPTQKPPRERKTFTSCFLFIRAQQKT